MKYARKNEILRGCDYVLRRLDNERSCPMGYSVPRKIEYILSLLWTLYPTEHSRSFSHPYLDLAQRVKSILKIKFLKDPEAYKL